MECRGYIRIMEKKMETTTQGLGFRITNPAQEKGVRRGGDEFRV